MITSYVETDKVVSSNLETGVSLNSDLHIGLTELIVLELGAVTDSEMESVHWNSETDITVNI